MTLRHSAAALLVLGCAACASAPPSAEERPTPARIGAGGTITNPAEQWVATPHTTSEAGVSEQIPASADEVYAALPVAYAAAGIEVGTAVARTRTLGNTDFSATRRLGSRLVAGYVRCAENPLGGSMEDTRPVRFSVLSTVTPEGESTRLTTRVQATTRASERSGAIVCRSTGLLEAHLATQVKLALVRRASP
jgi:hypothetical protein